jgi:predicted transcriptional regulator
MNTVTLGIATRDQVNKRFKAAMGGKSQGSFISFESLETLLKVLSIKRWQIIDALTGIEPVSIREAARLVNRDVKAVHGDIHALLNAGILRKEDSKIIFPFDRVRVDFELPRIAVG